MERILKVNIEAIMKWLFRLFQPMFVHSFLFLLLVFCFVQHGYPILHSTCSFLYWQCVCFDRVCVHMRFELCHPPKHFIPKMKIYKNDCRQTSCAFFLSSNQKECVFLLNSLSFHHHFAFFFSLSICINLLLVFFDRTKSERENIQNDTKYYTIDEKERKKEEKKWKVYRCTFSVGLRAVFRTIVDTIA